MGSPKFSKAVPSAPGVAGVRVREVMSRGPGPRTGAPPPEGVDVDYPLVLHTHEVDRVGCEGSAAYSSSKGGLEFHCADRVLADMEKKAWDAEEKSAPVKARIPLHRLGMPLEIADLVLCLALPASDVICGPGLFIDGGYGAV